MSARGIRSGCLLTADSPALEGQVPSGACWEGVRAGVADMPSPRSPSCGPRDLGEVRWEWRRAPGAGGRPSSHALQAPPRPPGPAPVPWLGGRPPRLPLPACRAAAAGGVGRRGSCACVCVSVRSCRHRLLLAVLLLLLGPGVAGRARAWKRRRLPFLRLPLAAPLPPPPTALWAQAEPGTAVCLPRPPPPPPPPRLPPHPRAGAESRQRSVRAATGASSGGGAWPCRVGEGNEPQSPRVSAEQRRRHQVPAELE